MLTTDMLTYIFCLRVLLLLLLLFSFRPLDDAVLTFPFSIAPSTRDMNIYSHFVSKPPPHSTRSNMCLTHWTFERITRAHEKIDQSQSKPTYTYRRNPFSSFRMVNFIFKNLFSWFYLLDQNCCCFCGVDETNVVVVSDSQSFAHTQSVSPSDS